MNTLIWIAVIIAVYFILKLFDPKKEEKSVHTDTRKNDGDGMPAKLLDLDKTTLADRQRAYHRGYRTQMRYDILQRQAELADDTATLEAIRTNTYDGPLPILEDEVNAPKSTYNPNAKVQELQFFCIKDKGYHVSVWPKDLYPFEMVEFQIAGISYRKQIAMQYLGETRGFLASEPNNPHDPKAIRVMTPDGNHIGYVPHDMTDEIRRQTKLPCPCYFYIGISKEDNFIYTDAYIKLNNK